MIRPAALRREVGVMRKKLLVISGLFALVGTIAVAAVLGIAGVGKAASTNTCAYTAPGPSVPNCLTVGVFPGQLSPTGKGLIVAKFVSQASATSTHTTIKVKLPDNVSAVSASPSALCSVPTAPGSTVTCSLGNVPGFGTAKVSVAFTTTAGAGATLPGISAQVTYAEGNGSNGNDTFTALSGNVISIADGTTHAGDCTTTTGTTGTTLLNANLNGQTKLQINTLSSLLGGFACTPIAGGVESNTGNLNCGAATCTSPVSFVIVPTTGTATLTIPVSLLASGMNASKFTLYWFPETGATGTPLMKCSATQDQPTPGTDTCIKSQIDLKVGNVKYIQDVLTIFGGGVTLIDAKFAG